MFPQCRFSQPTAKGNWPTSSYSKWYQEPTSLPTRKWRISQKNQYGFEQMLKLLMNLLIFLMGNTFSCVCVCVCVCVWVCVCVCGGGIQLYVITKWPKFLSCSHLLNFGSHFPSIGHSKLYINSSSLLSVSYLPPIHIYLSFEREFKNLV